MVAFGLGLRHRWERSSALAAWEATKELGTEALKNAVNIPFPARPQAYAIKSAVSR